MIVLEGGCFCFVFVVCVYLCVWWYSIWFLPPISYNVLIPSTFSFYNSFFFVFVVVVLVFIIDNNIMCLFLVVVVVFVCICVSVLYIRVSLVFYLDCTISKII